MAAGQPKGILYTVYMNNFVAIVLYLTNNKYKGIQAFLHLQHLSLDIKHLACSSDPNQTRWSEVMCMVI